MSPSQPTPSQPTPTQRIEELEVLFTHLQRTVQELDHVVVNQSRRLDVLSRELKMLLGEVRSVRDASREVRRPEDEIPPHY